MTLSELTTVFLSYLSGIKRYSEKTTIAYASDLEQFVRFCEAEGKSDVHAITQKTVSFFLMHLSEQKYLSSSVARKLSAIRHFFTYLFQNKLITNNIASGIRQPKVKRLLPDIISQDQFSAIYGAIEKEAKLDPSVDVLLFTCIFELLYGCSIRVSELCGLKKSDVDFSRATLTVRGKGDKTRLVPVGSKSLAILRNYLQDTTRKTDIPFLLIQKKGRPVYQKFVYRIVQKYLSKVSELRKQSPHVLRHASATHMLDNGADLTAIKEILGHENLSTTQIYTHTSVERLKSIYKKSHPKS